MGDYGVDGVEEGFDVDVEDAWGKGLVMPRGMVRGRTIVFLLGHYEGVFSTIRPACIVDEDVQATEALLCCLEYVLPVDFLGHVCLGEYRLASSLLDVFHDSVQDEM